MFLFGKKKQEGHGFGQKIASALRRDSRFITREEAAGIKENIELLMVKINIENKNINVLLEDIQEMVSESADRLNENIAVQELKQVYEDRVRDINHRNTAAVKALLHIADLVEDFYTYAKQQNDPNIREQARLMWANAHKALTGAGLAKIGSIGDEEAVFDPRLNQIQGTVCDGRYANGAVMEVLRSGYIYRDEVIRKAAVVVNKRGLEDGE